ncbi:hypothetical protein M569_12740 [Genlisea aurea]|uniref:Armadillo-like repeats domain-containing protein n=1 Tax=Genlisea aurea TaxID=192259 RepID=S8DGV6_9LAMI|nr:hypothetical protein M569_12740 [Genlisea aurea]
MLNTNAIDLDASGGTMTGGAEYCYTNNPQRASRHHLTNKPWVPSPSGRSVIPAPPLPKLRPLIRFLALISRKISMITCSGIMQAKFSVVSSIGNKRYAQFLEKMPVRCPQSFSPSFASSSSSRLISTKALSGSDKINNVSSSKNEPKVEEEEVEEELPWIQEKALDLVEFTGSVTQAIPGPRVGQSSLPWVLAVPLAYLGITFVVAFVKTVRKFNSPREQRRKLVNRNAVLCKSIDELFEKGTTTTAEEYESALKGLIQKTGFDMEEVLRKYIRYALNEKPFNADLVSNLIQLRQRSQFDDSRVAAILNEISRRIVKEKGPVVMDMSGYTEKGFKRKLAVQSLFGKIYYLSELPEFCSRDSSLTVKEIFGASE